MLERNSRDDRDLGCRNNIRCIVASAESDLKNDNVAFALLEVLERHSRYALELGRLVCHRLGDRRDLVCQTDNIRIGDRTAEQIKHAIGAAILDLDEEPADFELTGPNMLTALPQTVTLSYSEIAYALDKSLVKLDAALMKVLETMPPELYGDIVKNGIYLAGGGALIKGLDKRLSKKSGLPVHIAEDPLRAIARGTSIAMKNVDKFSFLIHGE